LIVTKVDTGQHMGGSLDLYDMISQEERIAQCRRAMQIREMYEMITRQLVDARVMSNGDMMNTFHVTHLQQT
jgi:hypothetical protein